MEKEEIINGNKLIAEFMGYTLKTPAMRREPEKWKSSYWEMKTEGHATKVLGSEKSLAYHYSWDWIMRVVDKIESLNNGIYQVDILQEGCKILRRSKPFLDKDNLVILDKTVSNVPEGTTKLESLWLVIVEFIGWWNNNNVGL